MVDKENTEQHKTNGGRESTENSAGIHIQMTALCPTLVRSIERVGTKIYLRMWTEAQLQMHLHERQ